MNFARCHEISCFFFWRIPLVAISYGRPGIEAATGGRLLDPEIQALTLFATLCGSGGIVGGGIGSMIGNELGSNVGDAVFNLSLLSELTEFVGTGAGALTGSLAGSGLTCAGLLGAVLPNIVAGRR